MEEEILEFIRRRFKQDCNWTSGNCYYFSCILKERFSNYQPELYYDCIDGHFICKINDSFYDYNGRVTLSPEYVLKYVKKWSTLREEDITWYNRIVRDVIL